MKRKGQKYERDGIFSIDEVFAFVFSKSKQDVEEFNGHPVHRKSLRYKTFRKGLTCVKCGLTASFFALERSWGSHDQTLKFHFNLYGVNEHGHEILFTKDHIIPTSKGGKNKLKNLQTMCTNCNRNKGNKIE